MCVGVIEKDARQLLKGLPMVQRLFKLPHKINLLLWLVSSLIARSTSDLQRLLPSFCDGFGIDPKLVTGLLQLAKRDYSGLAEFAQRFGTCDADVIDKFITLLGHLNLLSVSKASAASNAIVAKIGAGAAEAVGGVVPKDLSTLSYKDLFQLADVDKSGSLTFNEFLDLRTSPFFHLGCAAPASPSFPALFFTLCAVKYMSLPLSQSVALRIFSEVERGDGTIGQEE